MRITTDSLFFPGITLETIRGLARYYETMESQLQVVKRDEHEQIITDMKNLYLDWEDELAEWDSAMQEHAAVHDMLFCNFFRYSFIVLLLLVLEDRLHELCQIVGERPVPRAKREAIKTYKDHLKECGVSVREEFWESIHNASKVRNCIVHVSGNVRGCKDECHLRNLAQRGLGLRISDHTYAGEPLPLYLEDDMLILEPEYCRRAVADVGMLLAKLCDAVPLRGVLIEEGP